MLRVFSDFEKELIGIMIDLDEKDHFNVLSNQFSNLSAKYRFPEDYYVALDAENDVSIRIKRQSMKGAHPFDFRSVDKKVSRLLVTAVELYKYLEAQKLIYLVGDKGGESIGNCWAHDAYDRCNFIDHDIQPIIYKYSKRQVFVSEELKQLALRDFKSAEEVHHEQEMEIAKSALMDSKKQHAEEMQRAERAYMGSMIATLIALLGVVASIVVPLLTPNSVSIDNDKLYGKIEVPELSAIHSTLETSQTEVTEIRDYAATTAAELSEYKSASNTTIAKLQTSLESIEKELAELRTGKMAPQAPAAIEE